MLCTTTQSRKVVLLLAALVLGGAGCSRYRQSDFERLQGSWAVTQVVIDGVQNANQDVCMMRMAFTGPSVVFHVGETTHNGYWSIDETSKPRQLTITPPPGDAKHKKLYAIYELDSASRTLKMCFSEVKHPKKFQADAGSGCILVHFSKQ
jgi:uncharacterized protein (TIGR03067 family)